MALKLITPATELAVSLADAKVHLRIDADITTEDTLVTALIMAATEAAEQATQRAIMTQVWEVTLDAFPPAITLPRVPVVSVTSLKYFDMAGIQQTINPALYALDTSNEYAPASVAPVYGGTWPAARDQLNTVTLRFTAGYANAAAVPASIAAWIKLMVGSMYENREGERIERGAVLSLGFADRLLDRYKVWQL